MKKLFGFLFAVPSLCFALANDLILMQRNPLDTGTLTRIVPWTTYDSLYWYDPVTMQPRLVALGSGLSVTSGVLSVSAAGDWSTLAGKPGWTTTFDGSYPSLTGRPSLATVATTGSYDDLVDKPSPPAGRVFSYPSRPLNTCFQVSASRDAAVSYAVDVQTSLSLAAGQQGTVYLELFAASGCAGGAQEVNRFTNGQTGALTIGLSLVQNVTGTLAGVVPAGGFVRLRTENNTGSPTFSARAAQEVLL